MKFGTSLISIDLIVSDVFFKLQSCILNGLLLFCYSGKTLAFAIPILHGILIERENEAGQEDSDEHDSEDEVAIPESDDDNEVNEDQVSSNCFVMKTALKHVVSKTFQEYTTYIKFNREMCTWGYLFLFLSFPMGVLFYTTLS